MISFIYIAEITKIRAAIITYHICLCANFLLKNYILHTYFQNNIYIVFIFILLANNGQLESVRSVIYC